MAFKIEATPGVDIARLPKKFGPKNKCNYWLIGNGTIGSYLTGGETVFVGLRERGVKADFSLPALCGIRTYGPTNFINGAIIKPGERRIFSVGTWELILTSL